MPYSQLSDSPSRGAGPMCQSLYFPETFGLSAGICHFYPPMAFGLQMEWASTNPEVQMMEFEEVFGFYFGIGGF